MHTTRRTEAYWTRNNKGLIKTKGQPVRIRATDDRARDALERWSLVHGD